MAERATADYMNDLVPDATMRQVFDDLYERGDTLANELHAGLDEGDQLLRSRVPGTPIDLEFGYSDDNRDEASTVYRWINAGEAAHHRSLYYLAEALPDGAEPTTPSIIAAFRNGQFLMPAYSLNLRPDGVIVSGIESHVHMYEPDKAHTGYGRDEAFAGSSEHDGQAEVASLDDREQKRLRLITNAITWGIVRTEMLRDGADFDELFDIKPEHETTPAPSKHFSLKWLLGGGHQPA